MNKYPQTSIIAKVRKDIIEKGLIKKGERVVVALSGGPDSMCLLFLLNELRESLNFSLSACHFNHRLRGAASNEDQEFVLNYCKKNNLDCILGQAEDKNIYKNEEEAREARYSFFKKILEEGIGDKIAIAHNQNDLSETFLMRVIRGTGIQGLRSIPYAREKFIRPLLSISRPEIESYLKESNISSCTDKTNLETIYSRNKIRLGLIPYIMKEFNPNVVETLSNMSKHFIEDYDFIEESALIAYKDITINQNNTQIDLNAKQWLALHPSVQRMVLRLAIRDIDSLVDITTKQIDEAVSLIAAGVGKKHKILPRLLRIELRDGKITILKKTN